MWIYVGAKNIAKAPSAILKIKREKERKTMAYEYELLPPIVQDILPAFSEAELSEDSQGVKFYFSTGNYNILNSLENGNVQTIQVMIQQQLITNSSYKAPQYELILAENSYVQRNSALGDHYIFLSKKFFSENTFYKIQLRWSKTLIQTEINSEDFSEWSKTCLIKCIKQPKLNITAPFFSKEGQQQTIKQISFIPYEIAGYIETDELENIKNVNIVIKETDTNSTIIQSGEIIPNNSKYFSYILNKELKQGVQYNIIFSYTTESGYTTTREKQFISISRGISSNPAIVSLNPIQNEGKMQIIISILSIERYMGNFVIRRASSDTGFSEWEDVQIVQFISQGNEKNTINQIIDGNKYDVFTWTDKTINCGTYYKYGVAPLKKNGWRGTFEKSVVSKACFFDDIYLMGDNKQLRIKFDPTISNFKKNYNENVQVTLGSKYPFVSRNGENDYKSFSLGGLITTYMDTQDNSNVNLWDDSLGYNRNQNQNNLIFVGKADYFGRLLDPSTNKFKYDKYNNIINLNNTTYDSEGYLMYKNSEEYILNENEEKIKYYFPLSFNMRSSFGAFQTFDKNDEIKDFTSKEELFNQGFAYPDETDSPNFKITNYNTQQGIDRWEDIIYEREFRNKVIDFLYKNTVKLFRSNTEGTMLIKLININLTPKQQLGRMLYSFSADAIEIDDYNIFNCDKYNIQNINEYKTIKHIEDVAGNFMFNFSSLNLPQMKKYMSFTTKGKRGIDILKIIKNKYRENWKYDLIPTSQEQINKIKTFHNLYDFKEETLKFLKLEIYSPPCPIVDYQYWYPQKDSAIKKEYSKRAVSGYLLDFKYKNANSQTIIIKSNLQRREAYLPNVDTQNQDGFKARDNKYIYIGTYIIQQVKDLQSLIIQLPEILNDTQTNIAINIDYILEFDIQQYNSVPILSDIKTNAGQIVQSFEPEKDIIQKIKNDYYYYYFGNNYLPTQLQFSLSKDANNLKHISTILSTKKEISNILAISFDTSIGAVVQVNGKNHILNMGYLKLSDYKNIDGDFTDINIESCAFLGMYLSPTSKAKVEEGHEWGFFASEIRENLYYPRQGEYIYVKNQENEGIYENLKQVEEKGDLIPNGVYTIEKEQKIDNSTQENYSSLIVPASAINNDQLLTTSAKKQQWIFYNNKWYYFSDNFVKCPVDAIVNYIYEGGKITYQLIES